jgi:hypothetical protein
LQFHARGKGKSRVFGIVGVGGYLHDYFYAARVQGVKEVNGPWVGVVEGAHVHKVYVVFLCPFYDASVAASFFKSGPFAGSVIADGGVVDVAYAVSLRVYGVGTQRYPVTIGFQSFYLGLYFLAYSAMG